MYAVLGRVHARARVPLTTTATTTCSLTRTMAAALSTRASMLSPLLSTEQVESLLQEQDARRVRLLDASWYLDKSRNGKREFAAERIADAAYFDIEDVADKTSSLPHMLPTPDAFARAMDALDVANDDTVVVYVGPNCFSAARCWWTLKYFGHDRVHIMNGGLAKWKREGRATTTDAPQQLPPNSSSNTTKYTACASPALVVSWEQVLASLNSDSTSTSRSMMTTQIADARGAGRFAAKDPEPRPGMRGGHIPGALNVPFTHVVDPDDYSLFRDLTAIERAFTAANVSLDATTPVITSCGSGVTACVLTFGLHLVGKPLATAPVYDGSWSEWGMRSDLPLEK